MAALPALADVDELQCSLCLKLLFEPVTTPCGHTFCRPCLQRCMDHDSRCPMCRRIMHIFERPPVTVVLSNLIQRLYPTECAARAAEEAHEEEERRTLMPMFVVDATIFPGTVLALHVFEPRYRLMVRRCMEGTRQLGVMRTPASTVGTVAHIESHQMLADGRSLITLTGRERVHVSDPRDVDGYVVARVQPFSDEAGVPVLGESHAHCAALFSLAAAAVHGPATAPDAHGGGGAGAQPASEPHEPRTPTAPSPDVCRLLERAAAGEADAMQQLARPLREWAHVLVARVPAAELQARLGPLPPAVDVAAFSMWCSHALPFPSAEKEALLRCTNTLERLAACWSRIDGAHACSGCCIQ